jgi:hypothetical protein
VRVRTRLQVATAVGVVALAGSAAGAAAAARMGPFGGLGAVPRLTATRVVPAALRADGLYPQLPPPPHINQIVIVHDPAPPRSYGPTAPRPASAPAAETPASTPGPQCWDDCGGDGGGGGGDN